MAMPSFYKWSAEHLRFTMFTNMVITSEQLSEWWQILSPEGELNEQVKKPRTGEETLVGTFLEHILEIRHVIDKIDIILRPNHEISYSYENIERSFSLGVYESVSLSFLESLKRWANVIGLDSVEPTRIAFGTVLVQQVDDSHEGYSMLSSILPFIKFKESWSDFNFQVNDPVTETLEGLGDIKLNFINKYYVARLRLKNLETSSDLSHEYYFCKREVDNNTDVLNQKNLGAFCESILNKLVEL